MRIFDRHFAPDEPAAQPTVAPGVDYRGEIAAVTGVVCEEELIR
jgi:hypothetical protein